MINLPLTKIGFFNPGRLSDQEIEQSFITRIPFFELLFKKIIAEKAKSIPQHYLVIGQRGMGKTSLLFRIAAELRKTPYNNNFIPLSFPEEQYNIDRLSKFWLNCLDALADALDKGKENIELINLDQEIGSLAKQNNIDAKLVYDVFAKWIDKIGKRPVLLVDNLNLIFAKITIEEQHQLRAILISNAAPILVGASATTIDETIQYGAPFYDAFQINYLKKLSFKESLEVLVNLAKITGNENFENTIYTQKGRLEALYQLTGGTPRTLTMLFPLIQEGFSENIQTDLDALLDVVTPLYKAKFEELAPQLQVVMDAVALHWDPINLEQLRTLTQLDNAQLSPQLKRLVDVGWLQKLDAYKAKGGAYELTERFFNIWYLMRRSSRRQKRELYCLTKFLESFYGKELNSIAQKRINSTCENHNHIALDLALADAVKDASLQQQLKTKSYSTLIELSINDETVLQNFTIPKTEKDKKVNELSLEIQSYIEQKNYTVATEKLEKLVKLDEQNNAGWGTLGDLYSFDKSKSIESEKAYQKALAINENNIHVLNNLGSLQAHLSKNTEAEESYKKILSIDKNNANAWYNLGHLYQTNLFKYKEAENYYKKAIAVDEKLAFAWNNLGFLYQYHLNRYEEAEVQYRKALTIDVNLAKAWYNLGNLYKINFSKYSEAEGFYKLALNIDEKYADAWYSLGNLYQFNLIKYEEAENAYKKALEIDNKLILAWSCLGLLYHVHLSKYADAEVAYKRGLVINEQDDSTWNRLGNLYQDYLGKYKEAEEAYKKALVIDKNSQYIYYNLVFLWRDKMGKLEEAKKLFDTIEKDDEVKDSYLLNQALFALYDSNLGIANNYFKEAFEFIGDKLPIHTQDDWYRAAAVSIQLGFGKNLLEIFANHGYDIILKPLYVAIEAIIKNDEPLFFNSIAAEVREPAKKIADIIGTYFMAPIK